MRHCRFVRCSETSQRRCKQKIHIVADMSFGSVFRWIPYLMPSISLSLTHTKSLHKRRGEGPTSRNLRVRMLQHNEMKTQKPFILSSKNCPLVLKTATRAKRNAPGKEGAREWRAILSKAHGCQPVKQIGISCWWINHELAWWTGKQNRRLSSCSGSNPNTQVSVHA